MPAHIEVRGLSHVYGAGERSLTALRGVDLEAGRGEFVSVIGPSGAGKTTLLKAIGGLLEPTEGEVRLDGASPEQARGRKAIGFMTQDPSLLPWLSVLGNVALPLRLNPVEGQPGPDEAERLVEAVGLAEFRDYHPHRLSGGMRQRVAFARALTTDPEVLLMDEPLGALDEITRASMRHELLRVWEDTGKTVVLVTHSIPEAVMMSDRVAVLSSRPGMVLGQVHIDLPRPREESLEGSARFQELASETREILTSGATRVAAAVG